MANDKRKVVRRVKASTDITDKSKTINEAMSTKASEDKSKTDSQIKQDSADTNTTITRIQKRSITNGTKSTTTSVAAKQAKKTFIIFRPFVALGQYIANSWRELRQVQWPNRRATWKMTLAVIIFCLVIGIIVLLIDWLSQTLIQEVIL